MAETRDKNKKLTPFVKWAGGKRQLLREIRHFWPKNFRNYIEPFVGGGIVYLALKPNQAVLGDANEDLINCYAVVRDHVDEMIKVLCTYVPNVLGEGFYYWVRGQDVTKLGNIERAARFIFLNKTCYNGLYRVNHSGNFNVPFGKYERPPHLYDEANLRAVSQLLQNAELLTGDFESTVVSALKADFVYFDPPYHRSTNSHFTAYSINGFSEDDHVRLAKVFRTLHERGCKLLLSNSDTNLVRELYKDFIIFPVMTSRSINCVASKRSHFPEVLVMNYTREY